MILCASMHTELSPKFPREMAVNMFYNNPNIGLVRAYHQLWEQHRHEDVQVYIHDDVEIYEQTWALRVLQAFQEPKVAIVGLGGATGIGMDEIYKRPFRVPQLTRLGYRSNQQDWETHGTHETGTQQVAVVDGFFLAIRGSFLREVDGWKWIRSNFHCYDTAMCLEAYRRGWIVKMVGVSCLHQGGGTSASPAYLEWCKDQGTTPEDEHLGPHQWLYDRYRDVLPLRIGGRHE